MSPLLSSYRISKFYTIRLEYCLFRPFYNILRQIGWSVLDSNSIMARVVYLSYFWGFYDDKTKTFCRGFSDIYNLYIVLHWYNVSEHSGVGEHMGY